MADSLLLNTSFVSQSIQDYYNFFNGISGTTPSYNYDVRIVVTDETGYGQYTVPTDADGKPQAATFDSNGKPLTYVGIPSWDPAATGVLTVQADGTMRDDQGHTFILSFGSTASGTYQYTGLVNEFRAGGSLKDDQTVQGLDARIAAFEQVIIEDLLPNGVTTHDYPYTTEGLRREFLDEVLALLLSRTEGDKYLSEVRLIFYNNSDHSQISDTTYTALDSSGLLRDTNLNGAATASTNHFHYQIDGGTDVFVDTNVGDPVTFLSGITSFDEMSRDQKLQLLNADGKAIYQYYEGLIDRVFAAGQELKKGPVDPVTGDPVSTAVASAITPVEIDGVIYDHVTTLKVLKVPAPTSAAEDPYMYVQNLIKQGTLSTFSTDKIPVTNTRGQVVGFKVSFNEALPATADSPVLLPVAIYNQATGQYEDITTPQTPTQVYGMRLMYPDEYLYYWNEAKTNILRSKLSYNEAVTREMQEDLRQANEVLAQLEKLAAGAKAPGGTTGADTVAESLLLDLWEARVSKPGERMFSTTGNDDKHTYADWQENRTNLKNYIDRKSAQSQQAMLDYQTVLNRYNNAFEVMSKIQEKIDGLLKGQLRNYN